MQMSGAPNVTPAHHEQKDMLGLTADEVEAHIQTWYWTLFHHMISFGVLR